MDSDMEERTARLDAEKGPCGVCGGKFSEHTADTVHQFTTVAGDLQAKPSHARDFKEKGKKGAPSFRNSPESMARLIKVLHRKGYLDDAEVLEVVGFSPPPKGATDGKPA